MNNKIRTAVVACSIAFGVLGSATVTATPASAKVVRLEYPNSDGSSTYGAAIVRGGETVGYGEGSSPREAKKNARKDKRANGVVAGPGCDQPGVLC